MRSDPANRNAEIGRTRLSPGIGGRGRIPNANFCCPAIVSGSSARSASSCPSAAARPAAAGGRADRRRQGGAFDRHRIKPDGSVHDNVFYSILDTEWPDVKRCLRYLPEEKYR
ncbi:hypothetical protein DLM86_29015 [Paenibacillus flagellatus]|uniref:N-acetyltransferase domain-containing protein n=1 Tax=Paenibacillus flagellatus TaxID=2211139 RepID=A0A2V5JZ18_9BACL|nr:hypothetical protein DLM86_29015 [Paenibacillus flagellatus]